MFLVPNDGIQEFRAKHPVSFIGDIEVFQSMGELLNVPAS